MKDFMKAKTTYIIALAVFFVFVSLSETTYSLFIKSDVTDDFGYDTGLLDLKFIEDEAIKLENAFPVIDSDGIKLKPYTLTLKNTGNLPYLFDLKMTSDSGSIDSKYIKFRVNDYMPHTLYSTNNVLVSGNIIYPNQEITYKINVWLDSNTPNTELGKSFSAKVVTSGSSAYKTLDTSGANYPTMADGMIPVYYNDSKWYIADVNNMNTSHTWYDYSNKMWANVVTLKDSAKYVYDITRKHDIKIDDVKFDNGNYVTDSKYFDINLGEVTYDGLSNIYRIKFNKVADVNYIMANSDYSYYYDAGSKKFIFTIGNNKYTSSEFNVSENTWYIVGYTYDGSKLRFYANGNNIGIVGAYIDYGAFSDYKLGTDMTFKELSRITFGDVLIYNRVLTDNEFSSNYKASINIIKEGLLAGYNNFMPMTYVEYYHNMDMGNLINMDDVSAFYVWIPRFKYMLWNATGTDGTDSYNAYTGGINIVFENGATTTGTVNCDSTGCFGDLTKTTMLSTNDNGKYYTHPAFGKSTGDVAGLWVSKYEISRDNEDIMSKPEVDVLVNGSLNEYYQNVSKMGNNYHIIKNTEWGAISYLAHSKYGVCASNKCEKITANDKYVSGNSALDTTTGNVYGVFDMAGSAWEYTMSSFGDDNVVVGDIPVSNDAYDLYNNPFILGDATKETSTKTGLWDTDEATSGTGNWIIRGGKGIYSYDRVTNLAYDYVSTRIIYK